MTVDDFAGCGWKAVLARADADDYCSMSSALFSSAKQAIGEDRQFHGKVLSLLAAVCSMTLRPESVNEPFEPVAMFQDRRSTIPDDFSDEDVGFFARIVDHIDDPTPKGYLLKARVADLVWLLQRPRELKYGLGAIDSYRTIPMDKETWARGGDKCWQRAICLARMLKNGAGGRLEEIEASILKALSLATCQDGFHCLKVANLLSSNALARDHSTEIATKLETLARHSERISEYLGAREYFKASSNWFKLSGDPEKWTALTVEVAECWAKEADVKLKSEQPSHAVAATYFEKAIQTYRTIPRAMRAIHRVDDRIGELRRYLKESGEKSLGEMGVIRSRGVDIGQIVEDARNSLKGKALDKALEAFVNELEGENFGRLRESTIEQIRSYPVQALFSATVMKRDGRVIAKRQAVNLSTTLSDEDEAQYNEEVVRSKMVENYRIHVDLAVRGYIWPVLEVLHMEHRLREADFVDIARQSPIVPIGREVLFGKALYAGYDHDYVTALHILIPQIENMVRYHLKQAGVNTTNLDSNGIENEIGLNSLVDLSETQEMFGEDLSFEIEALFCDAIGPNLRNELAHGLLDERACESTAAIYAWWFGLKLVLNSFWNALQNDTEQNEQDEE